MDLKSIPTTTLQSPHHSDHDTCSSSLRNMGILQQYNESLYSLLISFRQLQPIPNTDFLTGSFQQHPAPTNLCFNKITYYYVCRTCKQNPYYRICADCFDLSFHRNHNYFTQTAKGQCDCGVTGCENLCSKHSFAVDYGRKMPDPHEKFPIYSIFLAQFFKIFIEMCAADRKKQVHIFNDILSKVTKINQDSPAYIQASCSCLSMKPQKSERSLLLELLELNKSENFITESTCNFFKILFSSAPFQVIVLEVIFSMPDVYNSLANLRFLQGPVQKMLKSHMVVGELARRNIVMFPHSLLYLHIEYWNLIQNMMNYGSKYRIEDSLIAISKLIISRYGYQVFNQCPNNKLLQFLYSRISSDQVLLSSILSQVIETKRYAQITQYQSDAEWFNLIVRVVLYSVNGEIDKFPHFFTSFKLQQLAIFVRYFFKQAFRTNRKCKFNGLTAVCLFKLAQCYGFVDQLNNLPISESISCAHFANNLIVVLRNLVAADHLILFQLLKIAEYQGNESKVKEYRSQISEWFHDFLFIRKQLPQKLIESLKNQGLINFQSAIHILQTQTDYNSERRVYVYKGRGRKVNSNNLMAYFKKQFLIPDLKHGQYSGLFSKNKKNQIFQTLYGQNIKKVSLEKYMSYGKDKIYIISVTAVILDQMLNGQFQRIRIYAQNLKNLSLKMKKSNQRIDKLFQIQRRGVFRKKEKTLEIDGKNNKQCEDIVVIELKKVKEEANIKQMSAAELQSNRRRAEKMQKIKDRFKSKSNKYSQKNLKELVDEEVCLVCRDSRGKPREKSFMFYLGSLKSDEMAQLVFGVDKNDQLITSCFHPFHEKCLAHHNRSTCILCKVTGNIILPVINQNPESQLVLAAWWNDLLSLKSFAPKANHSYSYYNPQPKTSNVDPETQKLQLLQLKERPFKNFVIIHRQLALRLSCLFGKVKFQDAIKKHTYFFNLIQNLYSRVNKIEKEQIVKEIQSFQMMVRDSKVTEYVKDLVVNSSNAILSRLIGEFDHKVKEKLLQIIRIYPKNMTQDFITNICWFLNCKLEIQNSKQNELTISNSQMIKYVYNVNIPTTLAEIYKSREKCKACHKMQEWFCIFCRRNGCRNCESIANHSLRYHNSGTLLAILTNGRLVTVLKASRIEQYELYQDSFNCPFDEEKNLNLQQFRYSPQKLNKALETIFKKF